MKSSNPSIKSNNPSTFHPLLSCLVLSATLYCTSAAASVPADITFEDLGEVAVRFVHDSTIQYPIERKGQPDPNAGTTALIRSNMYYKGDIIGSNRGVCDTIQMFGKLDPNNANEVAGMLQKCQNVLTFSGRGQVHLNAMFNRSDFDEEGESVQAVVLGGTGEFVGASGIACVTLGASPVQHYYQIFLSIDKQNNSIICQ